MKRHIITKDQLNDKNEYIGEVDLTDYDGALEAEPCLGYIKFSSIRVKFYINFALGTGIKAGEGIKAGTGIEAGLSISAKFISSKLRIFAGLCIWKIPSQEETEIRAELHEGVVAFGRLVAPKSEAA